jgi:hypothetical protein
MASRSGSTQRAADAARTGAAGTLVAGFAFFDGALIGAPIAALAATLRPPLVFAAGAVAVSILSIACCRWVDRRWDDWFSGHAGRIEKRLVRMRESRLMRKPVAWIQGGSDRRYALAAAVVNPILVVALARTIAGQPVSERRIILGSVAYAVPYVAMWSLVGVALGEAAHAV